jgi:hypothetical protein
VRGLERRSEVHPLEQRNVGELGAVDQPRKLELLGPDLPRRESRELQEATKLELIVDGDDAGAELPARARGQLERVTSDRERRAGG